MAGRRSRPQGSKRTGRGTTYSHRTKGIRGNPDRRSNDRQAGRR